MLVHVCVRNHHIRSMLVSFWVCVGFILKSFWDLFGFVLGPLWGHFRYTCLYLFQISAFFKYQEPPRTIVRSTEHGPKSCRERRMCCLFVCLFASPRRAQNQNCMSSKYSRDPRIGRGGLRVCLVVLITFDCFLFMLLLMLF